MGLPGVSGTSNSATAFSYDLSSLTVLTNVPVIYFRLVDASTTAINGGTVASAGTSRVDNFAVTGLTSGSPIITGISPSSVTTNAGSTVVFALTANPGNPTGEQLLV